MSVFLVIVTSFECLQVLNHSLKQLTSVQESNLFLCVIIFFKQMVDNDLNYWNLFH